MINQPYIDNIQNMQHMNGPPREQARSHQLKTPSYTSHLQFTSKGSEYSHTLYHQSQHTKVVFRAYTTHILCNQRTPIYITYIYTIHNLITSFKSVRNIDKKRESSVTIACKTHSITAAKRRHSPKGVTPASRRSRDGALIASNRRCYV